MNKRTAITTTQLVELYNKVKAGELHKDIAYAMGLSLTKVNNSWHRLSVTMGKLENGEYPGKETEYTRTARRLLKHNSMGQEKHYVSEEAKVKADRYEALDEAFKTFQNSLGDFVKAEYEERMAKVIKENEELKRLLDEAKHSNFVGTLKKQLSGE